MILIKLGHYRRLGRVDKRRSSWDNRRNPMNIVTSLRTTSQAAPLATLSLT